MMKTYKRELAVAGLVFWGALSIVYFTQSDPKLAEAYAGSWQTLTETIWLFTAAAFGMDWWSKQKGRA